jgi:hypothetical protein
MAHSRLCNWQSGVYRVEMVRRITYFVLFGIMFVVLSGCVPKRFNPAHSSDLAELHSIIAAAQPLMKSLEKHRQQKGKYPSKLHETGFGTIDQKQEITLMGKYAMFYNTENGTAYQFHVKLSWDPYLEFDTQTNAWIFDPGDGSPRTTILPKP